MFFFQTGTQYAAQYVTAATLTSLEETEYSRTTEYIHGKCPLTLVSYIYISGIKLYKVSLLVTDPPSTKSTNLQKFLLC